MILFYLTVLRFTKECDSSFVLPASKCSIGVVFVIVLFGEETVTVSKACMHTCVLDVKSVQVCQR